MIERALWMRGKVMEAYRKNLVRQVETFHTTQGYQPPR